MQFLSTKNHQKSGVYFKENKAFLDELGAYLQGKRVLEVFAGNGLLAAHLAERGVGVTATSIFSGMDAHHAGLYHQVEQMSATAAVQTYGDSHDVLLMSWPTVNEQAYMAAVMMAKPVVIIGEVTDYAKNHLGGCATDTFWACANTIHRFGSYVGRGIEQALVVEVGVEPNKSFLEARMAYKNKGMY